MTVQEFLLKKKKRQKKEDDSLKASEDAMLAETGTSHGSSKILCLPLVPQQKTRQPPKAAAAQC